VVASTIHQVGNVIAYDDYQPRDYYISLLRC
jgi:hypothetical protein